MRRFDQSPEFRKLLDGESRPSLARIALEIAGDAYPGLDIEAYLARIDGLADRIRPRCEPGARPRKLLGQVNWAMFTEDAYRANQENYFDPRNSYLNEVMDRKLGIPISLSILYASLAERLGVRLDGVNFPAHFMLRHGDGEGAFFIDCFQGGEFLDRDGCLRRLEDRTRTPVVLTEEGFAPCSPRVTIARMLQNLKAIYLGTSDYASSLPVQRRLAALDDESFIEHRDLGVICIHVDRPGEAIDPLQAYLNANPAAEDFEDVAALLSVARRVIAGWN
ncbi:SirB1 family protein [Aquisphaera insulae]|uniref:SirB1 family protein n=1 Tax=Aquisphaera insulae TaxID=2712864 RepID=UPI00202E20AF|nr:transglutaminase-like domain-containing protein [Aquisphaera insulae]